LTIEFGLFGGVEVTVDGRLLDLGPARQRCVLAVLLVELGTFVSVDRLVDRVWSGHPPQRARGALQSYLSRLRGILAGVDPSLRIDRLPRGYRLVAPVEQVDLHVFRRLVRQGEDDRALQSSVGELFAGFDTPWLDHVRTVVETERLAVLVRHADRLLDQGRHGELIPMLMVETDRHPLHERLAAQLMLAFHGAGQQAEALRVYDRMRRQLAEELGIMPGAVIQAMHQRILSR
jgi:DNA-binding SARP family transcriptional activator